MATLNPKALEALTLHQRQLDMDGIEVGVSRQALDELIEAYEVLQSAPGKVDIARASESIAEMVADWYGNAPLPNARITANIIARRLSRFPLSSTSAGVTEEQTPRDGLLAALRKAEAHIAITSGNGETDLRNELKVAIAKAEASLTCAMGDEMVEAALNVKPFDDGDENVQYILLRGLSAIGFKLPSHATWDVMRAALEASRAPVSQKEAVPVGERVVPVEPTDAMLAAGRAHAVPSTQGIGAIYRAMVAAAPVTHDEPVAEVVWFDPALELIPRREPHKIIDASLGFMDKAPLGTKLYASPVPAPAGERAIKALEWTQKAPPGRDHEPFVYWAAGLGGYYSAEPDGLLWMADDEFTWQQHPTQAAAKAAAQADYETRIRSALHLSPTPVSAPVAVVEKWPEPGDKMQFLDRNGYDVELEAARKVFTKGQVVTVKKFDLGGWCSSITFEELSGKWNSVMFARSPAVVEGK